jgi:hypothetical protein
VHRTAKRPPVAPAVLLFGAGLSGGYRSGASHRKMGTGLLCIARESRAARSPRMSGIGSSSSLQSAAPSAGHGRGTERPQGAQHLGRRDRTLEASGVAARATYPGLTARPGGAAITGRSGKRQNNPAALSSMCSGRASRLDLGVGSKALHSPGLEPSTVSVRP